MIQFTINGETVAQGRPRAGKTRTGKTVVYDPTKSRDYKQFVKLIASQNRPSQPYEGPIMMQIDVYKQIPKSMPKYKRELALEGKLRPTTKPDTSNYAKGIEDALNGIIYKDDSQIVSSVINKFYSETPRVDITVCEVKTGVTV
jgi:Holliday junction resolvase RusA-like endonuclease